MSEAVEPEVGRRPRQRRSIETRRAIYEEAMRQFSEQGIEATRVEDIVEAAGASWGTFFRYFPRKEDVLLEAAVIHMREVVKPVVERARGEEWPARRGVLELLLAAVDTRGRPLWLHAAALRAVADNTQRFAAMQEDGEMPLITMVSHPLADGQARGEVRTDIDPFSLAATVVAGTLFPGIVSRFITEDGADPEGVIRRGFSVVWPGVTPDGSR